MNENVAAARALVGMAWAPYVVSALPLVGGALAGWVGERRAWFVAGLWAVAMAGAWGGFNPLPRVTWVLGAVGLSVAGWALVGHAGPEPRGPARTAPRGMRGLARRGWLLGPLLTVGAAGVGRLLPGPALAVGMAGSGALLDLAVDRAAAGEVDEAVVYGEAAVAVAGTRGSTDEVAAAEVVTASLYASAGDCERAVLHARVAHATLGSDLPRLDGAVRECLAMRGP